MSAPGRVPRDLIRRPAPAPDSFPARLTEDGTGHGGLYGFVELEHATGGWRDKVGGRYGTYNGQTPAISPSGNEDLTYGQQVMLTQRVAFDEQISYLISTDGAAVVYEGDNVWIEVDDDQINHIGPDSEHAAYSIITGADQDPYNPTRLRIKFRPLSVDERGHVRQLNTETSTSVNLTAFGLGEYQGDNVWIEVAAGIINHTGPYTNDPYKSSHAVVVDLETESGLLEPCRTHIYFHDHTWDSTGHTLGYFNPTNRWADTYS